MLLKFLSLVQQSSLLLREFVDVNPFSGYLLRSFLRTLLKFLSLVQQSSLLLREFVDVIRSAVICAEFLRILLKFLSLVQQSGLLLLEFVDVNPFSGCLLRNFLGYCLNFCRSFSSLVFCCENLLM